MFIVIPLHRESLRQMMNRGLVTHSIKIQVLEMLKKQITEGATHGDIKDFLVLSSFENLYHDSKTKKQPDNILVDYETNGGTASNFTCILADWGTAGPENFGGTPLYAGPNTYENIWKDLFSFGRLALELFLDKKGKSQHFFISYDFEPFLDSN